MNVPLERLLSGAIPWWVSESDVAPSEAILLPGSFNPLHRGHSALLAAAERITGRSGLLELSIANVDKPPLDADEIRRRLRALHGRHPVVQTRAATLAEKAELFPGAWFALGYDTVIRLLSPDYHAELPAMLRRFRALHTRFAVAGRISGSEFRCMEVLRIPDGFEDLFIPIPESAFREDISSTELRKQKR